MPEQSEFEARIGSRINERYLIERFLGLGGVGTVYLARDEELSGAPVALKILYSHLLANPLSLERFRSEVLIARRLSHPNIVKIHEFGRTRDNLFFVVMEYIEGTTLTEILAASPDGRLSYSAVVYILHEIASAIGHAHQQSVVHRDLKPQNVLIGSGGRVSVCDFGLARCLQTEDALTRTGEAVGTPYYMAPELFRGEDADERTDVYAMGIIAHELLSGSRPFVDSAFYALAMKHLETPIPALPQELHAPSWIRQFIQQATAKERAGRPASALIVATLFAEHLDEESLNKSSALLEHWHKREVERLQLERRRKFKLYSKIALLVCLIVLITLTILSRFNSRQRWIIGRAVLKLEKYAGPLVLWPLKRLFAIDVDFEEQTLRDLVAVVLAKTPRDSQDDFKVYYFRIRMLIEAGLSPNTKDEDGVPLIIKLIAGQVHGMAEHFISSGRLDPQIRDSEGRTLLHIAIMHGMVTEMSNLMNHHAVSPEATDADGYTSLHYAVAARSGAALEIFRQNIPGWERAWALKDRRGFTPFGLALLYPGYPVDLLLQIAEHSDPNAPIDNGKTPLILAVLNKHTGLILPLLERGARLEDRDEDGRTALYYASRQEDGESLRQLINSDHASILLELIGEVPEETRERYRKMIAEAKTVRQRMPKTLPDFVR